MGVRKAMDNRTMRRALIALSLTAVLAIALLVQDLLDSPAAAWIGFVAVLALAIGWFVGLLPAGGDLGGDD
jgi:hypothetical protein